MRVFTAFAFWTLWFRPFSAFADAPTLAIKSDDGPEQYFAVPAVLDEPEVHAMDRQQLAAFQAIGSREIHGAQFLNAYQIPVQVGKTKQVLGLVDSTGAGLSKLLAKKRPTQ